MKTAEELVQELQKALGDNLVSAILHGSAVSGERTKKFSDVDLLLVLKDTGRAALAPALPTLRNWIKQNQKMPMLFSTGQVERAADVFPIEFSDIKDQRRVLAGSDPFAHLRIEPSALRRQLESELRVNLSRLQRHYVESGEKPRALAGIMAQSLSTFSALFRSALRLLGEPVPATKKDVWRAIGEHVSIDLAALEKIWDLRDDGVHLNQSTVDDLFERLARSIEAVITFVDLKN